MIDGLGLLVLHDGPGPFGEQVAGAERIGGLDAPAGELAPDMR